MSLFPDYDLPAEPVRKPSATQRLTIRNRRLLAAGIHPATRQPLLGGRATCGGCTYHNFRGHARIYHKCEWHLLGESHSAASDIRVGWPACALYVPDQAAS